MKLKQFFFRFGLVLYSIGLLALVARQRYSFHFFMLSLFYPVSRWATWLLAWGAASAGTAGVLTLGTVRRRRMRRRIWMGWGVMVFAGIVTLFVITQ